MSNLDNGLTLSDLAGRLEQALTLAAARLCVGAQELEAKCIQGAQWGK